MKYFSVKVLAALIALLLAEGCVRTQRLAIVEGLQLFDSLLPVEPDSVVDLYARFNPATFHRAYAPMLEDLKLFIDRMNEPLPPQLRIDTLAIDHAIENFANAARIHNTLFLSSSYFFLFNDPVVLRSVVTHEFGHIHVTRLSMEQRRELDELWQYFQSSALFYLFRDGEYSGNARFGGHPDDSPDELFASAYNLVLNKQEELDARMQFVDATHHSPINRLKRLVQHSLPSASE